MKGWVRNTVIIMIGTLGTQIIKLPILNLSIFQIFVLFSALLSIPYILSSNKVKSGIYLPVCLLWFFSSILAWQVSINQEWAKSYFLLGMMTTAIFFIFPNLFSRNDIPMLERWLIRSQYIVIPFSIATVLLFNAIGVMPETIPLPGGMSITLDEEEMARGTAAGEVRLMLPYATPPVLSIIMAMCVTILFFNKKLFDNRIRLCLLVVYSGILILTGSRSGIMGIMILLSFLLLNGGLSTFFKRSNVQYILLGVFVFIIVVFLSFESEYFQKMIIGRFSGNDEGMLEDRHFLVPLDGLLIWLGSIKNFFIGIGFGSSVYMEGAHTYLPPYFLNSFVTLLAERGLLGLLLCLIIIWLGVRLFKLRNRMSEDERALAYAYIVAITSAIFYENFISYFVIFVIAMAMMLYIHLMKDLKIAKDNNNNF